MIPATIDQDPLPALRTWPELSRRVLAMLITAGVLAFLAPWGTDRLALPQRLGAWLGMVAVWEIVIVALLQGVVAWRRSRGRTGCLGTPWTVGVVVAASIPAVPVCLLLVYHRIPPAGICAAFYANSIGLGVIIGLLRAHLMRRAARAAMPDAAEPPSEAEVTPTAASASGFLLRHAPRLAGARLLALEAEDHYLRIHTDAGHALVLQRLRDAVDSLGDGAGGGLGVQVHRSFWVARDAAPTARRRGQAWELELPGGLAVPVSRANVAACRAEGWL